MPQKALTLSREVDECKPLVLGNNHGAAIDLLVAAVSGADAPDAAALAPSFLSNMVGRRRLTLSNPR